MPTGIPRTISYQRRALRLQQVQVAIEELGREAVLEYIGEMTAGSVTKAETTLERVERLTQQLVAEIINLRKEQK